MVKEINTVQDLINELKKFPLEMEVRDYCFDKIEEVKIKHGRTIIIHITCQIKITSVLSLSLIHI